MDAMISRRAAAQLQEEPRDPRHTQCLSHQEDHVAHLPRSHHPKPHIQRQALPIAWPIPSILVRGKRYDLEIFRMSCDNIASMLANCAGSS